MLCQGRAVLRWSQLPPFEMIMGPCGMTDAGEEGGKAAEMDTQMHKDMKKVNLIDDK